MSASDIKAAFFCDLDQTAIFSRRMVDTYSGKNYTGLVAVESIEAPVAFMGLDSLTLLQKLSKDLHYIPVTTRGVAQYDRLHFPEVEINHWIANNGGRVFFNGKEDLGWRNLVVKKAEDDSESVVKVSETIGKELARLGITVKKKSTDGLYISIYAEEAFPDSLLDFLKENAPRWHYQWSLQSKGIYLVPDNVTKQAGAAYLAEKLKLEHTYASGDSVFDLGLMRWADAAIKPNHGELWELGRGADIPTTEAQGVQAGKEILDFILNHYLTEED